MSNPIITAEIIQHSISNRMSEVVTFLINAPYFLDAELRTHRSTSQNCSSNRAIPWKKRKTELPFLPNDVRLNQAGMQGFTSISPEGLNDFHETVGKLHGLTIDSLEKFGNELDPESHIHKQHLNRYLTGFLMQRRLLTCNVEYLPYFFNLRLGEGADPAIQELAKRMQEAFEDSKPILINSSCKVPWHLPLIRDEEKEKYNIPELLKISCARCARISYDNLDSSKWDKNKDIARAEQLIADLHLTPTEHQLKPIDNEFIITNSKPNDQLSLLDAPGITGFNKKRQLMSGNIVNWIQYRHYLNEV